MKILSRFFVPLCVVTGALQVDNAAAAAKLSEAFDSCYFSPSANGRGMCVMNARQADGSHVFFGALYTYDTEGNGTWLILQDTFLEFQFENTAVEVYQFTGGVPGNPFDNSALMSDIIGSATVRVDSCNALYVDLDMDDDSGFPDVELGELMPVDGPSNNCAYREAFDGCPDFSAPFGAIPRACTLTGVYNEDIHLSNEITWVLDGLVRIGDDNANSATVTIEPGTVMIGAGQSADYLYVSPGSRIIANGTPAAPIILTSPSDGFSAEFSPSPGDVGGLVVSGNAPSNACPTAPFNCFSEFDQTQRFGGDDPFDSSGEISYFQVRYAGIEFQPNAEVNSFTFQGVGSGTTVHHLQAYRGQDDGVEFFGGTVNVSHVVVVEGGDDAIDWDLGFSGNLQYGLVINGEGFGEDYGIEGASNPDSFDAMPRATPTLANYTFIGNGNGDSAILFKDGSGGRIYNTIAMGYPTSCIEWADAPATYNAAGTPTAPNTDVSAFNGVIIDCDNAFEDASGAPYPVGDFFNSASFENNDDTNPLLDGYMPMSNSPALTGGVQILDNPYFDTTSYRGGFDGMSDWTAGWTHGIP
jgi:hypothetical protein